jgi:hypothetical protein
MQFMSWPSIHNILIIICILFELFGDPYLSTKIMGDINLSLENKIWSLNNLCKNLDEIFLHLT